MVSGFYFNSFMVIGLRKENKQNVISYSQIKNRYLFFPAPDPDPDPQS